MSNDFRGLFAWRDCPLFQACETDDWDNLAAFLHPEKLLAGSLIWHEGEAAGSGLYLLGAGSLELFRQTPGWGKPIILAQFGPGSALGSLPPFCEDRHSTSLRAVTDSSWLALDEDAVTELLRRHPLTGSRLRQGLFIQERIRLRAVNQRLTTLF